MKNWIYQFDILPNDDSEAEISINDNPGPMISNDHLDISTSLKKMQQIVIKKMIRILQKKRLKKERIVMME